MDNYEGKIKRVKELIENADSILIGAGAGLSTASGIDYAGDEFKKDFKDFIKKYHFTDLYTASFHNFRNEEEKWAYFSKHTYFADIGRNAMPLYKKIFDITKDKDYFVITTNVDDQFFKAGFNSDKVFDIQGSYSKMQCSEACHNTLYDLSSIVPKMIENIDNNLEIPSKLVPVCPVCGETMEVNLRKDANFVQDEKWYEKNDAYEDFLRKYENKNVVLLELGVGFNTPGIIRFPFEQMTKQNENWTLVRINMDTTVNYVDVDDKTIKFKEDINKVINDLLN